MRVFVCDLVARRVVVKVEHHITVPVPYKHVGTEHHGCQGSAGRVREEPGGWVFRGSLVESVGLWSGQPNVSEGCAGPKVGLYILERVFCL